MTEKNYVENLPVSDIARGSADNDAEFLYSLWQETNGHMPDESSPIVEYLPKLVILETIHSTEDSPNIVSVGSESLFAKLLPQAADPYLTEPRLELSTNYRRLVRQSYIEASKGAPRYDVIGSHYLLPGGIEWLKHERILLPFTAATGLRWIFCYSILREVRKIKPLEGQQDLRDCSPSPLDPRRLWLDFSATASPLACC